MVPLAYAFMKGVKQPMLPVAGVLLVGFGEDIDTTEVTQIICSQTIIQYSVFFETWGKILFPPPFPGGDLGKVSSSLRKRLQDVC